MIVNQSFKRVLMVVVKRVFTVFWEVVGKIWETVSVTQNTLKNHWSCASYIISWLLHGFPLHDLHCHSLFSPMYITHLFICLFLNSSYIAWPPSYFSWTTVTFVIWFLWVCPVLLCYVLFLFSYFICFHRGYKLLIADKQKAAFCKTVLNALQVYFLQVGKVILLVNTTVFTAPAVTV